MCIELEYFGYGIWCASYTDYTGHRTILKVGDANECSAAFDAMVVAMG